MARRWNNIYSWTKLNQINQIVDHFVQESKCYLSIAVEAVFCKIFVRFSSTNNSNWNFAINLNGKAIEIKCLLCYMYIYIYIYGSAYQSPRHTVGHHWVLEVILGLYLLSGQTHCRKISLRLQAATLYVIMNVSLWNLTGITVALLPRCPSIWFPQIPS